MKPLIVLLCAAVVLACAFVMSGCGSDGVKPDVAASTKCGNGSNYSCYLDEVERRAQAREKQVSDAITAIAGAAKSCPTEDARCVEHVSGNASMAAISLLGGGGNAQGGPAPPQREPSGFEKFTGVLGALSPIIGTLATGAVQWHQSDTSRDVSKAQYGFLDHVVGNVSTAAASVATAGPRIDVGGDYVSGTQTHVGGDQVGGAQVRGDAIGGDRIDNSGVFHLGDSDRYGSPGPYTGPICEGASCQPQPAADAGAGGG